jgi:hypothetical protein
VERGGAGGAIAGGVASAALVELLELEHRG